MKDQFVIACVESPESAAVVLPWARHFAERLNHKGLMALHVSSSKQRDDEWLKALGVPYVSMCGDWATAIEGLPTAFKGILAVTAVNPEAPRSSLTHPKTLLREFRNCKTAYLCVSSEVGGRRSELCDASANSELRIRSEVGGRRSELCDASANSELRIPNSALTMTHRREGKELLVWASYLARFLDSRITIAAPYYKDAGLWKKLANNLHFAEKLFDSLNIDLYRNMLHTTVNTDLATLDELHPDLLIARTTDPRDRDLVDLLLPLPELRLLTHPSHTPLLFLNPRDDLYILCD